MLVFVCGAVFIIHSYFPHKFRKVLIFDLYFFRSFYALSMHFISYSSLFFSFSFREFVQVWFQNARAKWRRMMMKQEGKAMDGEKGEGSIDLDTYNPHSPSYMLGPPSPTSMEWASSSALLTLMQKIIKQEMSWALRPSWSMKIMKNEERGSANCSTEKREAKNDETSPHESVF